MVNSNLPSPDSVAPLPPERQIALRLTPWRYRPALQGLLLLDARLAQSLARKGDPILSQIRLAWWREQLAGLGARGFQGEPLLAVLTGTWGLAAARLATLVDGWEELIGEPPLDRSAISRFAAGRGQAMAAFAMLAGEADHRPASSRAGERWALADFAARTSHADERAAALDMARAMPLPVALPRALRGLALLDGLAARAASRGGPLFAGRGAALAAMRLGLLGR